MHKLTELLTHFYTEKNTCVFIDKQQTITAKSLLCDVAQISAYVQDTDKLRWVIAASDSYDLTVSLLALLASGREPILLPNQLPGTLSDFADDYDAILYPTATHSDKVHHNDNILVIPTIDIHHVITFFTSGTTGKPKKVSRTVAHIMHELQTLEALFSADMHESIIYSTVSPLHIYGLLFYILWPLCAGRVIYRHPLHALTSLNQFDLTHKRITLVSNPALLKRITHNIKPIAKLTIFSSGGLLKKTEADVVYQRTGIYPIEILGSTETGAVASRQQQDETYDQPWTPLPDVKMTQTHEGLQVDSPFFGESKVTMGDQANIHEDGRFNLIGRTDRIVKIEENRVSLTKIEEQLNQHPYVNDVVALTLEKNRQAIAVVVHLNDIGKNCLLTRGKLALNRLLKTALSPYYPCSLLPKYFRYVDMIPVNPQGKYVLSELQQLFEDI